MSEQSRRTCLLMLWGLYCASSWASAWLLRKAHVSATSFELAAACALSVLAARLTVGFASLAPLSKNDGPLALYGHLSWTVIPVAGVAIAYTPRFGSVAVVALASLLAIVGYSFLRYSAHHSRLSNLVVSRVVGGATLVMALELIWHALNAV